VELLKNFVNKSTSTQKYNEFIKDPSARNKYTDDDVLEVFLTARLLSLLEQVKFISSWIYIERKSLQKKISKSLLAHMPKEKENSMEFSFKTYKMNFEEKVISSIAIFEAQDMISLGKLFDNLDREEQQNFIHFWVNAFDFMNKYDTRLRSNLINIKRFSKSIEALRGLTQKFSFQSLSLEYISAKTFIKLEDFKKAKALLQHLDTDDAIYLTDEIELREEIKEKNFNRAAKVSQKMVKFCTERNKNKSKEGELLNVSNCQIALDETYKILDQGGFEPFIISGTLLGMAREGKIFAHDKDFDLGILGWEAQFDIFSLLFKTNKYELNIHELKGSQTYTLTARHIQTSIAFDIFFFHNDEKNYIHGVDLSMGFTYPFRWSKFSLKEKTFGDKTYRCPFPIENFLSENYGDEWKVPDPAYDVFLMSPAAQHNTEHSDFYQLMINLRLINSVNNFNLKLVRKILEYISETEFSSVIELADLNGC
jgi:hypothetical protein